MALAWCGHASPPICHCFIFPVWYTFKATSLKEKEMPQHDNFRKIFGLIFTKVYFAVCLLEIFPASRVNWSTHGHGNSENIPTIYMHLDHTVLLNPSALQLQCMCTNVASLLVLSIREWWVISYNVGVTKRNIYKGEDPLDIERPP